jgi:hypothetical protein
MQKAFFNSHKGKNMWTAKFWKESFERAIRTAAQTAASLLAIGELSPYEIDWNLMGASAAVSAFFSLLTSVASTKVGKEDTASFIR